MVVVVGVVMVVVGYWWWRSGGVGDGDSLCKGDSCNICRRAILVLVVVGVMAVVIIVVVVVVALEVVVVDKKIATATIINTITLKGFLFSLFKRVAKNIQAA